MGAEEVRLPHQLFRYAGPGCKGALTGHPPPNQPRHGIAQDGQWVSSSFGGLCRSAARIKRFQDRTVVVAIKDDVTCALETWTWKFCNVLTIYITTPQAGNPKLQEPQNFTYLIMTWIPIVLVVAQVERTHTY
jgi:hypothetical protein